ncbi:MAG: MFS transporter [Proteobacteria bacterium]|nr:MFS transporter [Pseudomonadota bacterium]
MADHAPAASPATPPSSGRRDLILAACMMATFMAAVEGTIVATAMPTIVAELGDFHLFSWVFSAYLLPQAVSVPIYGRLADLYGRRRVFYAGAGLFLLGSTLCGFANAMPMLIACRAIQGMGAGAVQPLAYTIVGDIYTPTERARVQGLLSSVFGIAAIIGPSLGAFLADHVSWAAIFWVNLPIGLAAMAMLTAFYREQPRGKSHRIDYAGAVLLTIGGGLLMLALVQGPGLPRGLLFSCIGVGAVAMAVLAWHERRVAEPMLPFRLWRHRMVALSGLGSFTIGALMMGVVGFLPSYVRTVMNLSTLASGLALGAMTVTWSFASFAAGRLMIRTSYRATATLGGLGLLSGSLVLLAMTPTSGLLWASTGAMLVGLGMGFCNTTYLVSVQAAVDWHERGAATSSNMFMRIVGQSVGAALFGAVVNIALSLGAPMQSALGNLYFLSTAFGVAALALALRWPRGLGPTHSR